MDRACIVNGERTEYVVWLPYTRPPLSLNQRQHWSAKRRIVREVRDFTALHLQAMRLEPVSHIRVTLHYVPRDKRRRDSDNLVATLKPILDGIVDSGLVADDSPEYVTSVMPVIDKPDPANPRLYVSIIVVA